MIIPCQGNGELSVKEAFSYHSTDEIGQHRKAGEAQSACHIELKPTVELPVLGQGPMNGKGHHGGEKENHKDGMGIPENVLEDESHQNHLHRHSDARYDQKPGFIHLGAPHDE